MEQDFVVILNKSVRILPLLDVSLWGKTFLYLRSPSMKLALETGVVAEIKNINTFVDGAAI